jgi:hypothetical protein
MSFYPNKRISTFDGVEYYQLSSQEQPDYPGCVEVEAGLYTTSDIKNSRFYALAGVCLGILSLFCVTLSIVYSDSDSLFGSSNQGLFYSIDDICKAGTFRDPQSQLKPFLWNPFFPKSSQKSFPVYWTLPLSSHSSTVASSRIKKAIIVQHGNLRNGNDYFCSAVEAIRQINASSPSFDSSSFIILSPQFLIEGDLCWNPTIQQFQTIDLSEGVDCDQYVWDSSGWKDGKPPLNMLIQPTSDSTSEAFSLLPPFLTSPSPTSAHPKRKIRESVEITEKLFFSFDIFNLLINQLLDASVFPNLYEVTLFGFSAGGQTLLRYSLYPNYNETSIIRSQNLLSDDDEINGIKVEEIAKKVLFRQENEGSKESRVAVRTVVGDISSYLYFDERRPFPNASAGFGVPDKQWITQWKVNSFIRFIMSMTVFFLD